VVFEINYKIVMCGLICLSAIYISLLIFGRETETIGFMIISIIALAIGVVIPAPAIDKKGNIKINV
jgi:hypothetical protein